MSTNDEAALRESYLKAEQEAMKDEQEVTKNDAKDVVKDNEDSASVRQKGEEVQKEEDTAIATKARLARPKNAELKDKVARLELELAAEKEKSKQPASSDVSSLSNSLLKIAEALLAKSESQDVESDDGKMSDVSAQLNSLGYGGWPQSDWPSADQIKFFQKKPTVFLAPGVKDKTFWPHSYESRHQDVAISSQEYGNAPITNALARESAAIEKKKVDLSARVSGPMVVFVLSKIFFAMALAGSLANFGGIPAGHYYVYALMKEGFSETVTVILEADLILRRGFQHLSELGVKFGLFTETEKNIKAAFERARHLSKKTLGDNRAAASQENKGPKKQYGKGKGRGNANSFPQSGYGAQAPPGQETSQYSAVPNQYSTGHAHPYAVGGHPHQSQTWRAAPAQNQSAPMAPSSIYANVNQGQKKNDISVYVPLVGKSVNLLLSDPQGWSETCTVFEKLDLDEFAPPATPQDGEEGLAKSGFSTEQPKGIWTIFDQDFSNLSAFPEEVFLKPFPLSRPRPLPLGVKDAAEFVAKTDPSEVIKHWEETWSFLGRLKEWSTSRPESSQWLSEASAGVQRVVAGFDPLFTLAAAAAVNVQGEEVVYSFLRGFPLVGYIASPGTYSSEYACEGPLSVDSLIDQSADRWGELPRLLGREDFPHELWEEAMGEVEKGWLEEPVLLRDFEKKGRVPCRRFSAPQSSKIRGCDNSKRSLVNKAASVGSKICLPRVDDLGSIANHISSIRGPVELWKADLESAYKHLPMMPAHAELCVIALRCPGDGEIYMFKTRTQTFGSSSAVLCFNTTARFLGSLFVRLFRIPTINYFDDYVGVATHGLGHLALSYFMKFCNLIGFKCKDSKCSFGEKIEFLGLQVNCERHPAEALLPTEKRTKYRAEVVDILNSGSCTPAQASSLAGKLNFPCSFIWGRTVRVYLKYIYRKAEDRSNKLSDGLVAALQWWAIFLENPFSRKLVQCRSDIEAIVHTDASLEGIGAVLILRSGESLAFSPRVPSRFVQGLPPKTSPIFILELYGALLGISALQDFCYKSGEHPNTVLSVDNNPALCALLRGYAKDPYACEVIQSFWARQIKSGCGLWVDRVRSSFNRADGPSRNADQYPQMPFPKVEPEFRKTE